MKYNIVSGVTQVMYHTVPKDESLMLTTPKQKAILEYLAQIPYAEFPEFVRDILVKVEGHKVDDITDGPGDEKQDILTFTPDGRRCLTQCKHTIDYNSNYNGDDLDLMVAAAIRKNCRVAIFVTNGNLTPQGKKYVTDQEYARGWPSPSDPLLVDYWNSFKIWDKIKGNPDILNKWFSGLGQTNGLRSFKFDLTVQQLPYDKEKQSTAQDGVVASLVKNSLLKEVVESLHYQGVVDKDISINVKKWFQFSGDLDINYLPPQDDPDFIHKPLYSLTIEVTITNADRYSPRLIREKVIKSILEKNLEELPENRWWHITSSQIIGFIYLHDIGEPRKLIIDSAETFVKVGKNEIVSEMEWCTLGSKFIDRSKEEDDDSIFYHSKSGCQVIQLFDQRINPIEDYNFQIIQRHQLSRLLHYEFRAVENIDSKLMMRIRKFLPMEWVALQMNEDTLIWCFSPDTEPGIIERLEKKVEILGKTVKQIMVTDIPKILDNISFDMGSARFFITSNVNSLSFPIDLQQRVFWISKELKLKGKFNEQQAINLLKFKFAYEQEHGFDNLSGETTLKTHTSELPELLYDPLTFRGTRMLDIAIRKNPIMINIRFRDYSLQTSNELALSAIREFSDVYKKISEITMS